MSVLDPPTDGCRALLVFLVDQATSLSPAEPAAGCADWQSKVNSFLRDLVNDFKAPSDQNAWLACVDVMVLGYASDGGTLSVISMLPGEVAEDGCLSIDRLGDLLPLNLLWGAEHGDSVTTEQRSIAQRIQNWESELGSNARSPICFHIRRDAENEDGALREFNESSSEAGNAVWMHCLLSTSDNAALIE